MTSPSINSASSNCVSAAVVPFSALSILIALNVANAELPAITVRLPEMFNGSGRLRNRARDRLLRRSAG